MATSHSITSGQPGTPEFPPLDTVTAPTVTTRAAAYYLNRAVQTMRRWACFEEGPLRPVRIHGRLAWRVADIRRLTEGAA